MNSFMSWVGGKKALRESIVLRLPQDCDRYVEVFGGGGWVLFYKAPSKFEVYNDFNPNLANLYRCVRDCPKELCEQLTYTLNSRTDFEHIRKVLHSKTVIPDVKRAAYFFQIIRESYASGLDSFGAQPHNMWRNFPPIHQASERLQTVVVENKDFEKLIKQYDRPNTIFYLDPPYYDTEDYYEDNLTIIRNAPEIDYVVGEGSSNTVTFDRTYYFKDKVTVSITDAYDEMAMFSVYDKDGELLKKLSIGETYEISASGTYTVIAVNHAGESEEFVLIISRNAPEIVMTESENDKQLSIVIKESVDEESHIQTLEIYKSTDGGTTWTLVEKDDYGTVVSLDTLSYKFRTTGLYKATLTDEFRTGIDAITAQLDYVQQNPAGTLAGVENGGYTNGKVSFAWTDEAVVTLTKDGKTIEYASGTELTEDGEYVLTFENFDGYKTTYSFTIDTAAPTIKLEGAENRESVNEDVKVYYTEENLTAELFKNGKSLGEYVSGNPV